MQPLQWRQLQTWGGGSRTVHCKTVQIPDPATSDNLRTGRKVQVSDELYIASGAWEKGIWWEIPAGFTAKVQFHWKKYTQVQWHCYFLLQYRRVVLLIRSTALLLFLGASPVPTPVVSRAVSQSVSHLHLKIFTLSVSLDRYRAFVDQRMSLSHFLLQ